MKKKIFALLMAVCLVITLLPSSAFAADTQKQKGEFVAVSRYVVKSVDENGIIKIKTRAPKPSADDVTELENSWPIIFAMKTGEGAEAVYTVIKDQNKIKCTDSSVKLYSSVHDEEDGNMGTYREHQDAYQATETNITVKKVGTYTFTYKGQSVKIKIKLPEYGYYTKPEATIENQILGGFRYDKDKEENAFYMIATDPENCRKIKFIFHYDEMAEYATLEQMGEYDEICKITINKPTNYLWLHCIRTFLNGDTDGSGNGILIIERPDKITLKKLSTSSKSITLSWKSQDVAGYQVKIATNKSFTKGVKTYTVTNESKKTIKKLTQGKRYYVKVRAFRYASGTYYGKWSSTKSVVCK